jgi:hypothetical protein
MDRFVTVSEQNLDMYLDAYTILICSLRNSRVRCKQLAIVEMYATLEDFGGIFITNCPLAEVRGKIAFFVPRGKVGALLDTLTTVGYCDAFHVASFDNVDDKRVVSLEGVSLFSWKKHSFWVKELCRQDPDVYQSQSPHNRPFRILSNGTIKDLIGYRGDGKAMSRRALPVEDCRCMLHLAFPRKGSKLFDPFAGAGGIVYAASLAGRSLELFSADIDSVVAPGLEMYGTRHFCGNSAELDFDGEVFDTVVTEVPFSPDATDSIISVLINVGKHLTSDGRVVLMCARHQSQSIRLCLDTLGYHEYLFYSVNRKGTEVDIIAYSGADDSVRDYRTFLDRIKVIY